MIQTFIAPVSIAKAVKQYCMQNNVKLEPTKQRCIPGITKLTTNEKLLISQWEARYKKQGFTELFICNLYEFKSDDYNANDLFYTTIGLLNQTITHENAERPMIIGQKG